MHTVELLEAAISLARSSGFVVRQDWFGGFSAGACEFQGRRWMFIDLALSPREQLEQVAEGLRGIVHVPQGEVPPQLHAMLNSRKAA